MLLFFLSKITNDSWPENLKTAVTISKKFTNFRFRKIISQYGLKFCSRVQLKAFFHDKEDDSNISNKDTFETLQVRKSKWTPPGGQFASLDFSSKKVATISTNLNSIVTPNFPIY